MTENRYNNDLICEYYNRNPGGHYFDDDTMRFFRSRLGQCFRRPDGTYTFVTSEQPPHGNRAYSVRYMDMEGEIKTVGPFCSFTRSVANRIARDLARKGEAFYRGSGVANFVGKYLEPETLTI